MATWDDLVEASLPPIPKQVVLITGEISSLVWDRVMTALKGYGVYIRPESDRDMSFAITSLGVTSAYLLVNPSEELISAAEKLVRGGSTDSIYILVEGGMSDNDSLDYLKRKAQQCKAYFTVTPPKTDQAKLKMATYFQMRWGVTRTTSFKACTLLDFSPGRLYMFDKLFLAATGGRVLPSSETQHLIDQLLGSDAPNTVVSRILEGAPIEAEYSAEFSSKILRVILNVILDAKIVKNSILRGNSTVANVCKDTGLTQFQVVRCYGVAEAHSLAALVHRERVLRFGLTHSSQPDVLSIIAQLFQGE